MFGLLELDFHHYPNRLKKSLCLPDFLLTLKDIWSEGKSIEKLIFRLAHYDFQIKKLLYVAMMIEVAISHFTVFIIINII